MDAAASSTLSPPTSCLNDSPSKRDGFFVPSSDSQGPVDDLLAAKMGMWSVSVKVSMIMCSRQICSTYLDSHVSEDLVKL